jgi:hypothetical protein
MARSLAKYGILLHPEGVERAQPGVSTPYVFSPLLNRPRRPSYPIIPYPTGRLFRGTLFQALRARLRSVSSLRDALTDILQQHLAIARARCEMSRWDGAIVAWHEVPLQFGHLQRLKRGKIG